MRKYTIQNWGKAVDTLAKLALKKKYAERFRLEYFQNLSGHFTKRQNLKNASLQWLSFLNIYRHLITNQLFEKKNKAY